MNNQNFGCPFHLFGHHIDDATTAHELYIGPIRIRECRDLRGLMKLSTLNSDQNAIACYICYIILREYELSMHTARSIVCKRQTDRRTVRCAMRHAVWGCIIIIPVRKQYNLCHGSTA